MAPAAPRLARAVPALARPPGAALAVGLLVVSLGVGPVALLPADSPVYAGIANPTPTVHTYTVAVALALGLCAFHGVRTLRALVVAALLWSPVLLWLALLTAVSWPQTARTASGLLQLTLAAAAFTAAAGAGAVLTGRGRGGGLLCWALAAVAWVQLAAVGLAALGLPLRRVEGAQALDVLGRATGLTAHPGELSKLLFFCGLAVIAVPQRTRLQRVVAWSTLAVVFVGVWLTQSRTVLVATLAMVGAFVALDLVAAGRWQRRHLAVAGMAAVFAALSLPWVLERFSRDGGGARGHVARVALDAIGSRPWTGVGPNGYVAVVGATDPLTATGVPVHNVALLSAAELGLPGAVLLWLPFAAVVAAAAVRAWRTRAADLPARIVLSATPGLLLIGATGWGLLQGPYLLLLATVTGYLGGWLTQGDQERVRDG